MNLTYRSHHCVYLKVTRDKNYKGDEWSLTRKGKKQRILSCSMFIGFELVLFHSPDYSRTFISHYLHVLVVYTILLRIQGVPVSAHASRVFPWVLQ
jgi:hypothetical protein